MNDVDKYKYLKITIQVPEWASRYTGMYLHLGSSIGKNDFIDSYCLSNFANVAGKTVDVDIPLAINASMAYITFSMPVTSGDSYGWTITNIELHN